MEPTDRLQQRIKRIKTSIDGELAKLWDKKIDEAAKIDAQYKRLLSEMKKFSLRGGKRLRPYLVSLGYEVAGGKHEKDAIQLGVAWELYHLFAVIHDDIMDQDDQRYGGPNIAGAYRRLLRRRLTDSQTELHARNVALLAGDIALGMSHEVIDTMSVDIELRAQLKKELNQLHFHLAAGQQLDDLASTEAHLKIDKIKKIYMLKTARYSMITPLRSGAILAGGNPTILNILGRYGLHAGIAYQIVDDLIGMFGTTREIGKPNISDLREGKRTLLMHYGFQFADDTQTTILKKFFGNTSVTQNDLKLVRKILTGNGAKAKTTFLAQEEGKRAKQAIGKLALPGGLGDEFTALTDYLVSRTK
ncbi:polyprenyl synthetase family protein [bacterium]|nr:polyprenyl synthetase family protein [bacterium]